MRKLLVSVLMLVSTLAVATPADAATPTLTGMHAEGHGRNPVVSEAGWP